MAAAAMVSASMTTMTAVVAMAVPIRMMPPVIAAVVPVIAAVVTGIVAAT